jgi:hypothetical protein
VEEGTFILIDGTSLPQLPNDSHVTYPSSWITMRNALPYIYDFPNEWKARPQIIFKNYLYWWGANSLRVNAEGELEINHAPMQTQTSSLPEWEKIPQGNLIFLKSSAGKLERLEGTLAFNDSEIRLKPRSTDLPNSRPGNGILYPYLSIDNCRLADIVKIRQPRRLDSAPKFFKAIGFDGTNHASLPSFDRADIKRYTIELWLKPGKNTFSLSLDEKNPPMPAIIGPLRIDHVNDGALMIMLSSSDNDKKGANHTIEGTLDEANNGQWLHLEIDVDNEKRETIFFVNGRLEKKFNDIEIPLNGPFKLGRGHLDRFWRGEIADVRISSIVRHTQDFKPESAPITRDEHTLYLMDGL